MLKKTKNKKGKKEVSSANINGTSTIEELGRSFTYNKNNIEAYGTVHLIYFCTVSVHSLIFIYCFLPFK